MAFTPITVTRRYLNLDLTPAVGGVEFVPQVPMINGNTIVAAPRGAALDSEGDLTITLAANNDPDTIPVDVAYLVRERIEHQPRREYYVVIPYDAPGGTVDLSTLVTATIPPTITFPMPGPPGPAGADGADGQDGEDGRTILNGTGAPAAGIGVDGDFYIDTTADAIYGPKTAGAWGAPTSLIGPAGPEGDPGPAGADGADGAPGADGEDGRTVLNGSGAPSNATGVDGDFYIDTAAHVIYGPKTAGAWGSGTSLTAALAGPSDLPGSIGASNQVGVSTTGARSDHTHAGEPPITAGTTSQYWRGDKSWQTLDKTAVGLANVDNTSDANKPISTATQTALNAKQSTSEKNQANGYAGLDASSKLSGSQQLYSASGTIVAVGTTLSAGVANSAARGDHVHTLGAGVVDATAIAAAIKDPAAATAGLRTLGTGATQAAAGNHTHAAADVASGTLDIARIPTGSTSTTVSLGNHTHTAPDTSVYETWNFAPRTQAVSTATANIDVGAAGDLQVTLTASPTLTPTNGSNGRSCVVECLASGAQRVPVLASTVKLTDGITSRQLTIPSGQVGVFLIRCSTLSGSTVYELTSAYVRAA